MRSRTSPFAAGRWMLGAFLALLLAAPASAQQLNELNLKAQYLVGFTGFVQWTDGERPPPISIGVVGDKVLFDAVSVQAARQRAAGRDLEARFIAPGDSLQGLDILFLSKDFEGELKALIAQAARYQILTVGESDGFIDAGGMIEFVLRKNRLRFEINLVATESNGMSLSSKLLRLAESTGR
jgi:hypothetical protein